MKSSIATFAKWAAILSFLLGTMLLIGYYFFEATDLIFLGYLYLIAALVINLTVFVILLYAAGVNYTNRRKLLGTAGLMTINIPIAILYLYFFLVLINTMRIPFINETGETITGLVIEGCETIELARLQPNERTTCWINIPNDCTISLQYTKDGSRITEEVFGYVTSSEGQKVTYGIGKSKKSIDETF